MLETLVLGIWDKKELGQQKEDSSAATSLAISPML